MTANPRKLWGLLVSNELIMIMNRVETGHKCFWKITVDEYRVDLRKQFMTYTVGYLSTITKLNEF